MRNLPSQRNITWKLRDSTRWDSLWGGSYSRRIGFLWLWGHQKSIAHKASVIYHARKITLGVARREKWYTWAVYYIVCCVQSLFKAPLACMPIMPAWMTACSQLPPACFICRRVHIHTPGWARQKWRAARFLHQNTAKSSSLNTIYLQMYTHYHYMYTDIIHTQYPQNCFFNAFFTNQNKNDIQKIQMYNNIHWETFQKPNFQMSLHSRGRFGSDNSMTRLHHDSRFGLVVGTFFVLTKQ